MDIADQNDPHIDDPVAEYDTEPVSEDGGFIDTSIGSVKRYKIAHFQYWVLEPYYKVADPLSGRVIEMDVARFKQAQKMLESINPDIKLQGVKLKRRKYMQAFVGRNVLSHGPAPCKDHFSWNCMTAKRDRAKGYWYGLVRAMKDPQVWANKWMSQILHIMNSNAKGGAFFESGVFTDQRKAEQDYAKPNAMIEVKSGGLTQGKLQERQPANFPTGYQLLTEMAMSAIRDVTGVNLEMLGMREANQPGVLEYQRRQAGLTVLAPIFNSLRRYRRARGKVMLYYITKFLADGRLIRIVGRDKEQYVPLVAQADAKYDIIVDDAPTSPNQKEMVWQNLTHILPGVKDIIPPNVLLELLDYSPLPTSVVQSIKDVVKAGNPEQEAQAKMIAQMEMAKLTNETRNRG